LTDDKLQNLVFLNLLLSIEGIGPHKLLNLYAKFNSFEKILEADLFMLTKTDGISEILAKKILKSRTKISETKERTFAELEKLQKLDAKIITFWDENYPKLLKTIFSPPLILYVRGALSDEDEYSVAIVGTRRATNYGKWTTEFLAGSLAEQNITIVSGMARGIDSIAHRTALKKGGRTIAVIGSGPDVIYPPENKKLFFEIIESGAVISEYPPGTKPDAQNFPKRNRIISGLSLGTVVVETKINGGAIQTANFALDQNREVFAVPGNLNVPQSEGTNTLIKKGEAKLIMNAADILDELEIKLKPVIGKNIPKPSVELNLFEEKIMNILNYEPKQIDLIANLSGINTSECLVHLLSLEFKGLVKQLPGKNFMLV